jgi:hypothetical protein
MTTETEKNITPSNYKGHFSTVKTGEIEHYHYKYSGFRSILHELNGEPNYLLNTSRYVGSGRLKLQLSSEYYSVEIYADRLVDIAQSFDFQIDQLLKIEKKINTDELPIELIRATVLFLMDGYTKAFQDAWLSLVNAPEIYDALYKLAIKDFSNKTFVRTNKPEVLGGILLQIVNFRIKCMSHRVLPTPCEKRKQRIKERDIANKLKKTLNNGMSDSSYKDLIEYVIKNNKLDNERNLKLSRHLKVYQQIPSYLLVDFIEGTPLLSEILEGLIIASDNLDIYDPVSQHSALHLMDAVNLKSFDTTEPIVKFERKLLSSANEIYGYIPSFIWKLHSYAIAGIIERNRDTVHKTFRDWRNQGGRI